MVISRIEAYAIAALAFLILVVGGFIYVRHLEREVVEAKAATAEAQAKTTIQTGQSAATTSAAAIADQRAHKDELSTTIHEDHAHALQAAPGAAAPVDPALNAAGRRGLCGYAAYAADPGCAGLRVGDPG